MELLSIFNDIGNAAGIPAVLLCFWLYIKVKNMQDQLDEGNRRFIRIEDELKENNGRLRELIGMFKMTLRAKDHTPEG